LNSTFGPTASPLQESDGQSCIKQSHKDAANRYSWLQQSAMAERVGNAEQSPFLDRLVGREQSAGASTLDLLGYVDAALTGSLPQS